MPHLYFQSYHNMTSSLVRGMPYGTMIYNRFSTGSILPTIHAEQSLTSQLLLDRASRSTGCVEGSVFEVRQDIEMRFAGGRTWLAFLSVPAIVQCIQSIDGPFMLQVVDTLEPLGDRPLVLRLAAVLVDNADGDIGQNYKELLRKHANVFPGESTRVHYEIDKDDAALLFDWDPTPMNGDKKAEIIAFAMPHHQDKLSQVLDFCVGVLLGSVCLVEGSTWVMTENLPTISFEAATSLDHGMLPDLVQAVTQDLRYRVPSNFLVGAGDTYFSGKALGKLARILLITHEVLDTCYGMIQFEDQSSIGETIGAACNESTLPSTGEMDDALSHLRQAVEIWLNGTAQAPLLYDKEWGGIVSCGCDYKFGSCRNVFPDCPGLTDQGLNFGAGFYNDHHFHYGYHIYAAATVAHFDRDWGRENFERILMLVRDIANPSADDFYFPTTRHKDWYHGSSWASGISQPPSPTGMNQESSSEAIAGYESVSLFGKVMSNIFSNDGDVVKAERADSVLKLGRLLAATELRSAKRYWHVLQDDGSNAIFDTTKYKHNVVGILWSSKVFFGTWFGNSPYLIYGIQLLPLTTISEDRDDMYWVREMFDTYAQSCGGPCIAEGWSVQILALLATLGHREKALKHAKELTDAVFDSPGGNGHSLSNTIWYISTRPEPSEPYNLTHSYPWEEGPQRLSCSSPKSCTDEVLASMAGQYACGSRISYLMNQQMKSEYDACHQIAAIEFPDVCGGCNPDGAESSENNSTFLEEDLFDGEEDIFSELETATITPRGLTCNQPSTCTADVLRSLAGTYPCGDRIHWLMTTKGMSEEDACAVIAVQEFPDICGGCNPGGS